MAADLTSVDAFQRLVRERGWSTQRYQQWLARPSLFLDMLAAAPHADPFVGPDQHALEEMLAGFEPATTAG